MSFPRNEAKSRLSTASQHATPPEFFSEHFKNVKEIEIKYKEKALIYNKKFKTKFKTKKYSNYINHKEPRLEVPTV